MINNLIFLLFGLIIGGGGCYLILARKQKQIRVKCRLIPRKIKDQLLLDTNILIIDARLRKKSYSEANQLYIQVIEDLVNETQINHEDIRLFVNSLLEQVRLKKSGKKLIER
jgi:hypothetical protein